MKIAAAYLRVSDERQDEYSPDSQLKLIREYSNKNDFLVPDEYVFYDDGISAKSSEKRTQFNQMSDGMHTIKILLSQKTIKWLNLQ